MTVSPCKELHKLASRLPFCRTEMTTCSAAELLSVNDSVPPLSCLAGDPGFKELLLMNTFL